MAVVVIASTERRAIEQFEKDMKAIGQSHVRALAFSLNHVAMDARRRITDDLRTTLDQPSAYTMRAIGYRLIPLNNTDPSKLQSDVHVRTPADKGSGENASAYLKYLMGNSPNTRYPGDIGPADRHIYVPLWRNLQRHGIRPINGQSLPRSALKRLLTLSGLKAVPGKAVNYRSRRSDDGGIFFGAPRFGGQQHGLGLWSRPKRVRLGGKLINAGSPQMLVRAADHATYKPILQAPWDRDVEDAMRMLPAYLAEELENKIAHLATKSGNASRGNSSTGDFLKAR